MTKLYQNPERNPNGTWKGPSTLETQVKIINKPSKKVKKGRFSQ